MPEPFGIPSTSGGGSRGPVDPLGRVLLVRLVAVVGVFLLLAFLLTQVVPVRLPGGDVPAVAFLAPLFVIAVLAVIIATAAGAGMEWRSNALPNIDRWRRTAVNPESLNLAALMTQVRTEPGGMMSVRIRPEAGPAVNMAFLGCFSLFWNGIVSVFIAVLVYQWFEGEFQLFMALILIPFVLIGIALFIGFLSKLLIWLRVPETVLEMEREPLTPGERARIHLVQGGQFSLNTLTVDLKCIEKISYTRGTDTYTETHDVYTERLLDTGPIALNAALRLEQPLEFRIPAEGPVSFRAPHNELVWRLEVALDVSRWPNARYTYPFRVTPAAVRARL